MGIVFFPPHPDVELAKGLVDQDAVQGKLLELNFLVESDTIEGKEEGQYRIVRVDEFRAGQELAYILDADPSSFEQPAVKAAIAGASTIFVNAVMGLVTLLHFTYTFTFTLVGCVICWFE